MYLPLILTIIAGISNAIANTLWHHYGKSIFKSENDAFWNPKVSWTRKYSLPKWIPDPFTDGWHIFKTLMVFALLGAIVLYRPMFDEWWYHLGYYGLLGLAWNLPFNLFYNKILIRK